MVDEICGLEVVPLLLRELKGFVLVEAGRRASIPILRAGKADCTFDSVEQSTHQLGSFRSHQPADFSEGRGSGWGSIRSTPDFLARASTKRSFRSCSVLKSLAILSSSAWNILAAIHCR